MITDSTSTTQRTSKWDDLDVKDIFEYQLNDKELEKKVFKTFRQIFFEILIREKSKRTTIDSGTTERYFRSLNLHIVRVLQDVIWEHLINGDEVVFYRYIFSLKIVNANPKLRQRVQYRYDRKLRGQYPMLNWRVSRRVHKFLRSLYTSYVTEVIFTPLGAVRSRKAIIEKNIKYSDKVYLIYRGTTDE